jgi:hypothetical protein
MEQLLLGSLSHRQFLYVEHARRPTLHRLAGLRTDEFGLIRFNGDTDKAFAANPTARLDFFYRRSPWWDSHLGLYPVGRLSSLEGIPLAP